MRRWAIFFLLVALVAGAVVFGGIAPEMTDYARAIFFMAMLACVFAFAAGKKPSV